MLVIDKPRGRTSHDVVALVRRRLRTKAGHTGTLDPQATGVLLLCLGPATRLARFLMHQPKTYACGIRLGWETDTYDADGERVGDRVTPPRLDENQVRRALEEFVGEIEQVPPVYSAKKIRGQPAYRRARRGETVTHEPVRVRIHEIALVDIADDIVYARLTCGPGTYVRTLAHDLGRALGVPSHLHSLRRERNGRFGADGALTWDELQEVAPERIVERVIAPADMLPDWPRAIIDERGHRILRNGGVIEPGNIARREPGDTGTALTERGPGGWACVMSPERDMLAAAEVLPGGMLQPRIVLAS